MANNALSKLQAAVQKAKEGSSYQKDNTDNFYYPETDAAGSGYAIIRWLPAKNEEDLPFVKAFNHGFKNSKNNRWYIKDCPSTIGEACPVCEANRELWSGTDADKGIARDRKRKTTYYSNILVVEDSKNPENEGKVFMFKFGKKIFEKITDKIQPEFEDEDPMNPFDPVEGADFKLRIRRAEGGWPSYEKCEFAKPSAIDEDVLAKAMEEAADLNKFVAKEHYESYDVLVDKLNWVLGEAPVTHKKAEPREEDDLPPEPAKKVSKPVAKPAAKVEDDSEDDDMQLFRKLAEDDD